MAEGYDDTASIAYSSITSPSSYTFPTSLSKDSGLNNMSIANSSLRNGMSGERRLGPTDSLGPRTRSSASNKHRKDELCKKIRITMALIGIVFLVTAIFMLTFYLPRTSEKPQKPTVEPTTEKPKHFWSNIEIDGLEFQFHKNRSDEEGARYSLAASMGKQLTSQARSNYTVIEGNENYTVYFNDIYSTTTLEISFAHSNQCYNISWKTDKRLILEDCFSMIGAYWYGLGELSTQEWPLQKIKIPMSPFLTSDYLFKYNLDDPFGGVLEPMLLNSHGFGIYIADHVPLFIGMNENDDNQVCLRADLNNNYYRLGLNHTGNELFYTLCMADNITGVHSLILSKYVKKPVAIPDVAMIEKPIWSTWAMFKKDINESTVLGFAKKIRDEVYPYSQLEIDDKYSTEYGDFDFNNIKFPDPVPMIDQLRSFQFGVSLWIHPFANLESRNFMKGLKNWVKVGTKDVPGITRWWNGVAGVLDTTSPDALLWFETAVLTKLKNYRINRFKFDAGEVTYLPGENYLFNTPQVNPNYYSYYYVKLASSVAGSEVRVGWRSQEFPVFVRQLDRTSDWGLDNGLRSVLTAALTFGILGYPFILPDMIGGNGYNEKPQRELYIRWAQLSTFLPVMQFSIAPWVYDSETVAIVRQMLNLREEIVKIILVAANESVRTGAPIIRPLWWYWPQDKEMYVIDTQFMLGEKHLIAPILHPSIKVHAVYMPPGLWKEEFGDRNFVNITGATGSWTQYNVTLWDCPYFVLVS